MTSPRQLLTSVGLSAAGVVRWGNRPSVKVPGVYLVATTQDPDDNDGFAALSVDEDAVRTLLRVRPEATVDGRAATEESVTTRLKAIWVTGEPVVYIGLAKKFLHQRVGQFYNTSIGASGPHSGGWPIKMLADLDRLWVHYAPCDDPDGTEKQLLRAFCDGLAESTVAGLHDPQVVLPYANLELTKGLRKAHGFEGVRALKVSKRETSARSGSTSRPAAAAEVFASTTPSPSPAATKLITNSRLRTQNVTPKDIASGKIRIPSATKRLFPPDKGTIDIELCGESFTSQWNPKFDPDRERSGVVSVPRAELARLVRPGRPLAVTVAEGLIRIGEMA